MELAQEYIKIRKKSENVNRRGVTALIVQLNRITDRYEWQPATAYIKDCINYDILNLLDTTGFRGEVTVTIYEKTQIRDFHAAVSIYNGEDIRWERH